MSERLTLVDGGINWTWYMEADFNGTDLTVSRYYRLHDTRDLNHPLTNGHIMWKKETDGRILSSVAWRDASGDEHFSQVSNPKHIFDYP